MARPKVLHLTVFRPDSGSKTKSTTYHFFISKMVETFVDGAGCKITRQ